MAHHSGTISVESTRWYKWFSIFGRTGMRGKKIKGFIYVKHTQVWDCGQTLNFYEYATKKDLFKMKLQGKI